METETPVRAAPRAFRPPMPSRGMLVRERLLRALEADGDLPLVVVSAQAGYGKTTLLAQWASADPRPFAWITLGPGHDDALCLIQDVIAAVGEVAPIEADIGQLTGSLLPPVSTLILPRLGQALRALDARFALVLDDAHLLRSEQALETLWVIATNLPPGCTLALGTRTDLPIRTSALLTRRVLRRLGPEDLAMTEPEAAELIAGAGGAASPDQVGELLRATEGWPAGLYLAALAGRERWPGAEAPAFAGDHHLVVDYVREELLAGRTPDEVGFLLGSSVLERLSGPACDALLDRDDSGWVLEGLARANLFIVPLDPRHERFRYHQLFSDALRTHLRHADPARWHALNMRAAAMALEAGDADAAVHHSLAAGEWRTGAGIAWRVLPLYLPSGRVGTLLRWLDLFAPEQEAADAHLALTRAWCKVETRSELVAHHALLAEQIGHQGPLADGQPLEAAVAVLRATIARDGIVQMGRHAGGAYALLADDSPWRGLCCFFMGASRHLLGDGAGASALLEEGSARSATLFPTIDVLCTAWLGVIGALAGDWDRARLMSERSDAIVREAGLREYGSAAISFALRAAALAAAGQLDEARAHMQHARRLLAVIEGVAPYFALTARMLLVRAAMRLGELAVAAVMLREGEPRVAASSESGLLMGEVDWARRAVQDGRAGAVDGHGALTSAEIRVLRFLPTHLSFREIGERLHVSRFTVKSQAGAVYRKLGVASRSEAVERGRELGLIET